MTTPIVQSITDEQLAELERSVNNDLNNPKFQGDGRAIVAGIAAVIARLRAAEADAKRLEWMINEGCIVQHQNGTASPIVFRVYWPFLAEQQPDWYPSEREAIDAAMERQP